nr:aminotransferase class I/II-fold pyridoxal phosphate-dependent enzyme [Candidatus Kerfeldbacteria bacterium]
GDMAPLDQITALANHYNAAVMIDDAHASGIYGIEGRGAAEHFSVTKDIDFLMGTLSKAFGAIGGFVSGKKDLIDMLKVNTSTYYFTSSLPASEAGALIKSISIAKNEPGLRKKLWTNVYRLLKGLLGIGLEFPLRFSQIIPIMVYEEKVAFQLEDFLYKKGVLCSAVTVPAVAPNMARLRVSVNATHTDEHIDMLLNVLSEAASLFNLPKKAYSKKDWEIFLAQTPKYILQLIDINKGN